MSAVYKSTNASRWSLYLRDSRAASALQLDTNPDSLRAQIWTEIRSWQGLGSSVVRRLVFLRLAPPRMKNLRQVSPDSLLPASGTNTHLRSSARSNRACLFLVELCNYVDIDAQECMMFYHRCRVMYWLVNLLIGEETDVTGVLSLSFLSFMSTLKCAFRLQSSTINDIIN